MHKRLMKELSSSNSAAAKMMPPLPPKTVGGGSIEQAFIDKRRGELQDFLVRMSMVPGVTDLYTGRL